MTDIDLPDVNVLVALLHPGHIHHSTAQGWFSKSERFATTAITESGFLRLALNPSVMGSRIRAADALTSLRSLRMDPRAEFLPDDSTLTNAQIDLVGLVGHKQVTDLHLVNLAASHHARLVTLDTKIKQTLTADDHIHVVTLAR